MDINSKLIVRFFRYLWIVLGAVIIFFALSQGIYTKRSLEYELDFSQSLSKDIRGWYPESRLTNMSFSSIYGAYDVIGEPIYMKIYSPADFDLMTVEGSIYPYHTDNVRLGLRQEGGGWYFNEIVGNDFSISFDLENAQIKNNELEIILSLPDMVSESKVRASLINNWKITLSR